MIWPILARYMITFAAGATWNVYSVSAKVLWVVVLVALVVWDTREALRRDRQDSRPRQRASELDEDRQIGMEPDTLDATDSER